MSYYETFTDAVRASSYAEAFELSAYLDDHAAVAEFLRDESTAEDLGDGLSLEFMYHPASNTVPDGLVRLSWAGVRLAELSVEAVLTFAHAWANDAVATVVDEWETKKVDEGASPDVVEAARTLANGFGLTAEQRRGLETSDDLGLRVQGTVGRAKSLADDPTKQVFSMRGMRLYNYRPFVVAVARGSKALG
jgi:hypothetical protein